MDCYDKAIECLDENGEQRGLQGKKKETSVRMVTTMETKCSHRNKCVLFAVHISSDKDKEVEDAYILRKYLVLQQFQDAFLVDISRGVDLE